MSSNLLQGALSAKARAVWTHDFSPCRELYYDIAKRLIQFHINVNHQSKYMFTPLLLAVIHNRTNIVELQLEHRADVNVITFRKVTPLSIAVRDKSSDIVKIV